VDHLVQKRAQIQTHPVIQFALNDVNAHQISHIITTVRAWLLMNALISKKSVQPIVQLTMMDVMIVHALVAMMHARIGLVLKMEQHNVQIVQVIWNGQFVGHPV